MGETLGISHNVFEKAERERDRKERMKKIDEWKKEKSVRMKRASVYAKKANDRMQRELSAKSANNGRTVSRTCSAEPSLTSLRPERTSTEDNLAR